MAGELVRRVKATGQEVAPSQPVAPPKAKKLSAGDLLLMSYQPGDVLMNGGGMTEDRGNRRTKSVKKERFETDGGIYEAETHTTVDEEFLRRRRF